MKLRYHCLSPSIYLNYTSKALVLLDFFMLKFYEDLIPNILDSGDTF